MIHSNQIQKKTTNFIIVLGGGVDKDEKITSYTKLRYDKACEIHEKYDYIICSSYKTYKEKAKNQIKTEAQAGKEYLLKKGIPENKILLEEKSMDTFSNAYYCRELIEKNFKPNQITIITSSFHMPKTKTVFSIVFPKKQFNINYIESENGPIDKIELANRLISENELIKFYNKHLTTTYNIKIGDMNSIKYFMEHHNSALTGVQDEHHKKLSKIINSKITIKNPLY